MPAVFKKTAQASPYKFRIQLLIISFLIGGLMIISKLFTWQVLKAEELEHMGRLQQKASADEGARRGAILASDGYPIAVSTQGWLVWAALEDIERPSEIADKLAPILAPEPEKEKEEATDSAQEVQEEPKDEKTLEEKKDELIKTERERLLSLLEKKGKWIALKQKIDNTKKQEVEKLEIKGIGFDPQDRRAYPEASMAAHLLGFVGKDAAGNDKGYFGLEGRYDVALSGVGGEKIWERDALGNPILGGINRNVAALNGVDLKTHIDRSIQFAAEQHLKKGLEKYGASQGTVIIMRPKDGAILAMTSLPSYESAEFAKYKEEDFINPAISQSFEPGSIFKVLIMAAALDSGAVKPDDRCDSCSGPTQIGKYTIKTWDGKYYANSLPEEIIQHSDNVGMVWAADRMGQEKTYEYLDNFGIGSISGIDLQGEASPKMRPKGKWGQIDLATTSFGQGIAVTPIQMVKAVSAIANKGTIATPQVVDKVAGNGWEEDIPPVTEEGVLSKDAAEDITKMMIKAVKSGEAKWAAPKGFVIAGKTGTAQIPIAGHYDPTKTIASFIGFAPADNPEFVMLVTLKEPTSSPWASETAAPLWFALAKDIFIHLGVHPQDE